MVTVLKNVIAKSKNAIKKKRFFKSITVEDPLNLQNYYFNDDIVSYFWYSSSSFLNIFLTAIICFYTNNFNGLYV